MSGFHVDIFSSNSASCNGGSSAWRKLRYKRRLELPINRKSTNIRSVIGIQGLESESVKIFLDTLRFRFLLTYTGGRIFMLYFFLGSRIDALATNWRCPITLSSYCIAIR